MTVKSSDLCKNSVKMSKFRFFWFVNSPKKASRTGHKVSIRYDTKKPDSDFDSAGDSGCLCSKLNPVVVFKMFQMLKCGRLTGYSWYKKNLIELYWILKFEIWKEVYVSEFRWKIIFGQRSRRQWEKTEWIWSVWLSLDTRECNLSNAMLVLVVVVVVMIWLNEIGNTRISIRNWKITWSQSHSPSAPS